METVNISIEDLKKILHAATGNVKDFVMHEDEFIDDFLNSNEISRSCEITIVSLTSRLEKFLEKNIEPILDEVKRVKVFIHNIHKDSQWLIPSILANRLIGVSECIDKLEKDFNPNQIAI